MGAPDRTKAREPGREERLNGQVRRERMSLKVMGWGSACVYVCWGAQVVAAVAI